MTKLLIRENVISKPDVSVKSKNCAAALVETLAELGVDSIFGYPGASVLSIYNELSQLQNIRHYLVRHEQAAVHAAEGYARVSGKPGVVLVTSGPGFTNTITGIANAYADSTPLVILAGDVPSNSTNSKVFQKVDIISMTKTCSKKNYLVSLKDDIKQIIKDSFEIAMTGEKGPVVIALPRNVLEAKYSQRVTKEIYKKKKNVIKDSDYEKIIKLLNASNSPLILLGAGATDAVEHIKIFASETKIPVVSTLMGIGTFPSENPLYCGMIGMNGTEKANSALSNSDFILALGVSFSDRSTCKNVDFAKDAKVVSVNLKSSGKFGVEIVADSNDFMEGLCERLDEISLISPHPIQVLDYSGEQGATIAKNPNEFNRYISTTCSYGLPPYQKSAPYSERELAEMNSSCLHSSCVLETIYNYTKNYEPIVVTDVGQHQMLTAQFFNFNQPKKFITSGGLGTMGFGLPASMGAQIANPNNLVLNITGDGSFQMNLQELATCREHNIPIKIVIMNNSYLGMVRQMQEKIYNNMYQVEMINPDFTKIAEAYDLFAVRVKTSEELIPALEKTILHKGTAIIDIAIDSFEEI